MSSPEDKNSPGEDPPCESSSPDPPSGPDAGSSHPANPDPDTSGSDTSGSDTSSSETSGSEKSGPKRSWRYLLKAGALTAAPLAVIGLVAGTVWATVLAAPTFILLFGIEAYRVWRGPSTSVQSLRWVGTVALVPTAFAVPAAVSARLDPTVPQAVMLGLVFLLPVLTVVGYAVLAGADRWLRTRSPGVSPGVRWVGLSVLGLALGGALPAWLFVRGELQEARVQEARRAVLEQAAPLEEQWALDMPVSDVSVADGRAVVRTGNSIQVIGPAGQRTRSAQLSRPGLPYVDAGPLDADPAAEIVVHGEGFNDTLRAFDDDGRTLWSYATPQGTLGSVALADLNADGRAEVATGSTTGGGLRLLSPTRQVLWADTTLWVSDVAARPPTDTDSAVVVAATGETLEFYRRDGTRVRSLRPEASTTGFALGIGSAVGTGSAMGTGGAVGTDSVDGSPMIFVGANGPTLVARSWDGTEQWRRPLPASGARLAAEGQFLAVVGEDQGRIYVFESGSGRPVAASDTARAYRGAEWIPQESGPPILLGWTEDALLRLAFPTR